MMSTIDAILVIFSILVLSVGIVTSIALIIDARRDLGAVRARAIGNGRAIVARSSLRTEVLRLTSLVALSIYVLAVAVVEAPIVARVAFIVAIAMLLSQSVSVYMMRRRLFDAYRVDRPHATAPAFRPDEDDATTSRSNR